MAAAAAEPAVAQGTGPESYVSHWDVGSQVWGHPGFKTQTRTGMVSGIQGQTRPES